MAELVFVGPDGQETHRSIADTDHVIGRDAETDIQVDDTRISRRHCRIGWRLVIEDLGSTNGLFHDGERIESRVLVAGDRIGLGSGDRHALEIRQTPQLGLAPAPSASPASGAATGDLKAAQDRSSRLEKQLEAARERILDLERSVARAERAAERAAALAAEASSLPAEPEPEPEPVAVIDPALAVDEESEIHRLRRSVLGLTRERDDLHRVLRERENRLTVLERDNWRLRTTGSMGDDTQITLRNELDDLRSALKEREGQLAAQKDEPGDEKTAAPAEKSDQARKLADREARIASLQSELGAMRKAMEGGKGQAGRGFVAEVAASLLDAKQVAVSTLRPGVDRDLSQVVRSLQHFAEQVERALVGTARAGGVTEQWGFLAEPGLVERQGEVVRSGGEESQVGHQTYLARLSGLVASALGAPDEAFAGWLEETWGAIAPKALRKQASLPLEGALEPVLQQTLWARFEETMRQLDTDELRERFRRRYREEVARV